MTRLATLSRHSRPVQLAGVLAAGALIGGGGYALAAGSSKTIHGCVDKRGSVLHIQRRCGRGQSRLIWNQQGPQGRTGTQGPAGAAAIAAWGTNAGNNVFAGQGLTLVQHVGPGVFQLQTTAPACTSHDSAAVVTIVDNNPPAGSPAGSYVVAWVGGGAPGTPFTVNTGVVTGGTFTPTDKGFNVVVPCS